jgi:hypothetical protein
LTSCHPSEVQPTTMAPTEGLAPSSSSDGTFVSLRGVPLSGRIPAARVRDLAVMNPCTITLIGKPERMSGFVDAYRARIVISDDGASRELQLAASGEDFLKAGRVGSELDVATWEHYAELTAERIGALYEDLEEIPDELRLGVLLRVG